VGVRLDAAGALEILPLAAERGCGDADVLEVAEVAEQPADLAGLTGQTMRSISLYSRSANSRSIA
jgi:hypothetical protein